MAQTAQAADTYIWTGVNSSNWNTKENWYKSGSSSTHAVPSGGVNADFQNQYFDTRFNNDNRRVNFNSNTLTNGWKVHVRKAGAETTPVVFTAETTANGLTVGTAKESDNSGYYIANDTGDAWLRLEKGTYKTSSKGFWFVGNTGFQGHIVSCSGVTMGCSYQLHLKNGSLSMTNTTLTVGGNAYFGKTADKTPTVYKKDGTWTISGNMHVGEAGNCTFVQDGGKIDAKGYLFVGNPGIGSLTINSGELNVVSTFNIGRGVNGNGTVVVNGGTVTGSGNIELGDYGDGQTGTALLEINGGTMNCNGNLQVGSRGIAGSSSVIRIGGTGKLVVKDSSDIYLGNATSGEIYLSNGGELTARTVFFCQRSRGDGVMGTGEDCKLELDAGGIAKVKCIKINNAAATDGANATVLFNGGTLKVAGDAYASGFIPEHGNLFVKVAENGGTIDTSNYAITIAEPLLSAENASGTMTFTGGGSTTLSAGGTFDGTVVVDGSTLKTEAALSASAYAVTNGTLDCFTYDATVATYTIDSLTLGTNSTLVLDADATGCDAFSATTTNITATAESPATIKLVVREMPESGHHFKLFAMDEADTNKVNVIAVTPAGASLVVERGYDADGYLTYAILAKDYVWNASQTNWSGTGAWNVDGMASDWQNNNNAVFMNAGDAATLDADATAVKLDFRADATVSGGAILTVPEVTVASGVSGSIDAATAGTLVKKGAGALTLGAARPAQTTVEEGTLALTNGDAAVTTANLTLGTDPEKSVTFDYGGNTLSGDPRNYLVAGMDITLTNGVFSTDVNPGFKAGTAPGTLTIASGAELVTSNNWTWNASMEAGVDTTNTINIAGGKMVSTKNTDNWLVQNSRCGTLNINVTDGGLLELGGETYALVGRDSTTANDTPSLNIKVVDSTFRIANSKSLRFGRDNNNKNPLRPTGVFAATNAVIDLGWGMYVGNNKVGAKTEGYYTVDFESCTITGRQISVYHDRPLNAVRFNNTRYVINADWDYWLETAAEFETLGEGGTAIKPMSVGPGGLVLDSNGYNGQLQADLQGEGAFTKTGTGTMTVTRSQTSDAPFNVEKGAVVFNAGVSVARPVSVASGATLKASGAATLSGGVTLAGGATLDVSGTAIVVSDVTVSGTATLKLNGGAFGKGLYSVLSKPGVTAADFDNVTPQLASGATSYAYYVKDDALYLAVDMTPTGFSWTGAAGDGKMSTTGNWWGGVAPGAGADVDFSSVWNAATIEGDIDATFGTVTMGNVVITFTGDKMRATSFSDTSKIAVGANATVTVEGDLMFADKTSDFYVLYTIGAGGKFVVTGRYGLNADCTRRPSPQQSPGGGLFVVGGFCDNAETWMFTEKNDGTQDWLIGAQGISGTCSTKGIWVHGTTTAKPVLQANMNDFSIGLKTCLRQSGTLTLNTTGDGDGEGHVITLDAGIYDKGNLVIAGKGKVVCAATATGTVTDGNANRDPYSGAVQVNDTATLAINAGMRLTTGAITVNSGATLQVAESGTVTLGGNLTLKNGAFLGFNYTNNNAPKLDLSGKTVTFDEGETTNIVVKISGVHGRGGEITSVGKFTGVNVELADGHPDWALGVSVNEAGNIVLDAKPIGLIFFVK